MAFFEQKKHELPNELAISVIYPLAIEKSWLREGTPNIAPF
jgi:hypothetical protein